MGDCIEVSRNKVGGFDKWDVEEAARTLIKSEEIRGGDAKFLKVVCIEVDKQAEAAMAAAKKKKGASDTLKAESNAGKRLGKIYGKGKK